MNFQNQLTDPASLRKEELAGKKILFATFPGDGHFNPLTGLAVHLQSLGCDVRWYTSSYFTERLKKLQITHYPFVIAKDLNGDNVDSVFPERKNIKGQVAKLNFDLVNAFILRGPEYYRDILEIYKDFRFEIMIADCTFTGIPFVSDLMNIPVINVGVMPLIETSKDLAPPGLGMTPSYTFFGRMKQRFLRFAAQNILFRRPNKLMRDILNSYGIKHFNLFVFDLAAKKSSLVLQSGTPGFEYFRSDLSTNIRFIGPLLPFQSAKKENPGLMHDSINTTRLCW